MGLVSFVFKKLGIKDKLLFFQYLATITIVSELGISSPVFTDVRVAIVPIDGLVAIAYLVARQKK